MVLLLLRHSVRKLGQYTWARTVYKHLMQFILRITGRIKRRDRGAKESTGYLNGRVIVLIVGEILSNLFINFFDEINHF